MNEKDVEEWVEMHDTDTRHGKIAVSRLLHTEASDEEIRQYMFALVSSIPEDELVDITDIITGGGDE